MSPHRRKAGLAVLSCLGLACFALAAQPAKDDPAAQDKEVVDSKAVRRPSAASVNFRKELNLPFATLGTLGPRVAAARRHPDPVALAHAAHELAVAEKVSGKKASLTSAALIKEAAQLAALRRQQSELEATLAISQEIAAQKENIELLNQSIALAKQQAKQATEAIGMNQEPTWAPRTVVVNNYTTQYLDVYVNGNLKGNVSPGQQQVWTIEHRWNPTVLTAYGNEDTQTWGPRYIWGRFKKYTWNIN
ncbi:MAG TPA: hypothetical protein VFE78_04420 [Gemmataceae bacterium]|jgi:hypothetical protein|nr:hypothetical protein [Gemmataceae bacterium]